MRRFIILAFALGLLGCGIGTALIGLTLPTAVSTAADIANQPDSVADTVFESRQTPPTEPGNRSNTAMVVLFIFLILAAGITAVALGGSKFLRQFRLTFKKARRQLVNPYSQQFQPLPRQQYEEIPAPRSVGRTRPVEEIETHVPYQSDSSDYHR